jgi:Protein of unknown function (DUF3592)
MRMHKNPVWLLFLGIISVIVLWYCGVALYRYYQYITLSEASKAANIEWSVKALSDEQYVVDAHYTFLVKGERYSGDTVFRDEVFLNAWAAEQELPKFSSQAWQVWYQPSNLNHSTLQKKFPLKECISAGVLLGLFLYFLWLGFYVTRYQA